MSEQRSLSALLRDPRLAPHATAENPVWLWSADAARILWGNPAAAAAFNISSPTALAGHSIDPKGSAALQIARLAGSLPYGAVPRLERLRGFGGRFGNALLCACSRIMLQDHTPALLIVATQRSALRCRSPNARAGCCSAATSRSRCSPPMAPCCMRRRWRNSGSAAAPRWPRSVPTPRLQRH